MFSFKLLCFKLTLNDPPLTSQSNCFAFHLTVAQMFQYLGFLKKSNMQFLTLFK